MSCYSCLQAGGTCENCGCHSNFLCKFLAAIFKQDQARRLTPSIFVYFSLIMIEIEEFSSAKDIIEIIEKENIIMTNEEKLAYFILKTKINIINNNYKNYQEDLIQTEEIFENYKKEIDQTIKEKEISVRVDFMKHIERIPIDKLIALKEMMKEM